MGYGTGSRQLTEREKLVADIRAKKSSMSWHETGVADAKADVEKAEKALADYDAAEEAKGMAAVKA